MTNNEILKRLLSSQKENKAPQLDIKELLKNNNEHIDSFDKEVENENVNSDIEKDDNDKVETQSLLQSIDSSTNIIVSDSIRNVSEIVKKVEENHPCYYDAYCNGAIFYMRETIREITNCTIDKYTPQPSLLHIFLVCESFELMLRLCKEHNIFNKSEINHLLMVVKSIKVKINDCYSEYNS